MSDTSLVFNILAKDKASKVFDKIKGSALVAGAAIGAALAAGVASTLEKSKTDAMLAAQLGAGPDMAAEFGRISGEVYARGVAGSLDEVNAALKGVWQNRLIDEDAATADIEAVAAKVVNLGAIMTEDADRVSSAVSQMLRTGLASSAEEAFDVLTRGVQQGVNKSQDLLDTFNEYGTQFRKLGLDGTTAMGLLSQAIKAGARDSDTAADALKEFSIRAVDGSKTSAEGFKMLGLNASKMGAQIAKGGEGASAGLATVLEKLRGIEDPVKRGQAAVALFGTKAEDLGDALFAMDPTKAAMGLGNVAGAADKAGQTLEQSAGAKLDSFKRKVQEALVQKLGEAVPHIEKSFGWLQKNSGWVTPLAVGLGVLAGAISTIIVITKIWTAVQTALNIVMMLNPVGLIIIAVMALIGIIILIATKTTWFQDLWNTVWGAIKIAAVAVWDFLVAAFQLWWAIFSGFWLGVGRFFKGLWDGIVSGVKSAWKWITETFDKVVGFVTSLPGRIGKAASGLWDGIKNSFKSAVNWIIGKWNNLQLTIGGGSIMGVGIPSLTLNTPNIPYLAKGGTAVTSGLAVVGERGPELLSLNKGAQVTPLSPSTGGRGGARGTVKVIVLGGDREAIAEFRRLNAQYGF